MDINKDKVQTREDRKIAIKEKIKEILELIRQDGENLGFVGCLVDREDGTGGVVAAGYGQNIIVALCRILKEEELKDCLRFALALITDMECDKSLSELFDELKLR